MNLRTWIRKTSAGRLAWRLFIGFIGGGITVFGAVLLVAPGPGVLVLLAGLGILATEFAWAGRLMMETKRMANKAAERTGMKPWVKYFLISGGAILSIITIFIYYSR
jgi:Putative transmembrane protein (PGPGW)